MIGFQWRGPFFLKLGTKIMGYYKARVLNDSFILGRQASVSEQGNRQKEVPWCKNDITLVCSIVSSGNCTGMKNEILFIYIFFCLRDSPRSKIKWEPTQIPAMFPLKLNFSFYQEAILALMLDRQLKGQQVPLVAFCQGFLTCLWIKISQEEGRPGFPVILKTAMNLKMLQKA